MRAQAEDGDLILVRLVEVGELAAEFVLGNVGAARMQDVTVVFQERSVRKSNFLFAIAPNVDLKGNIYALRRPPQPLTRPSASYSEAHCGGTCESAGSPERQPWLRGCARRQKPPAAVDSRRSGGE